MGLMRMTQKTVEVSPETSVIEAVAAMTEHRVGALAVTVAKGTTGNGNDAANTASGPARPNDGPVSQANQREIVGIFTERDLMRRVVHARRDPQTTSMRDVMTSPVQTVSDETLVSQAASLMRMHHIRHLAIVDGDGVFRGMVALRYLLYDLMDDLERKVDGLERTIMADGPGG